MNGTTESTGRPTIDPTLPARPAALVSHIGASSTGSGTPTVAPNAARSHSVRQRACTAEPRAAADTQIPCAGAPLADDLEATAQILVTN